MSLMDVQKIERDVDALLGVSGFRRDGAEQHLWLLLHHLFCAMSMYDELSAKDKVIIADTQKKVRYFFDSKCDLKERKRTKKEKEGIPPHPHAKEKENKKEKDEKTHTHLTRVADLDLVFHLLVYERTERWEDAFRERGLLEHGRMHGEMDE